MNASTSPVRWLALGLSLVLGAGFVAYRAGWLSGNAAQAAAAEAKDRTLMYSSKSGPVMPPSTRPATSTKPDRPRTVMAGSKSLIITPQDPPTSQPAPTKNSAAPQMAPEGNRRTIMPGSKSWQVNQ